MPLDGERRWYRYHHLFAEVLRNHLRVSETPSFEGYRFYGEGKLRTIPDGWRVLTTIFKEYVRSVVQPCRDLPMGFRGEIIPNQGASYEISDGGESLANR